MPFFKRKVGKQGTWTSAILLLILPLLIMFCFRWLLIEPFVIPSASMQPNLLIHDHIFVYKLSYGIKLPIGDGWLYNLNKPKRGDVVVFKYPENKNVYFVKRLIGLPGDKIKVQNGQVTINDRPWTLTPISAEDFADQDEKFSYFVESIPNYLALENQAKVFLQNTENDINKLKANSNLTPQQVEDLIQKRADADRKKLSGNIETFDHFIKLYKTQPHVDPQVKDFIVPKGSYFVMGDNRDQSHDSRFWGFVPHNLLVGKASYIWLSCEKTLETAPMICDPKFLRLNRLMKKVQ